MRISSSLFLLSLAACGQQEKQQAQARADEQRTIAAAPKFPCAQANGELHPDCTAERMRTDAGWIITMRHPDGHFRRVLVKDDNSIAAADGAQRAEVTPGTAGVSVAIGPDRYLLPVRR